MPASRTVTRQYVVRGRVQGVGFRYFVERCAVELRLRGYVRNRADGAVEVYAVGPPDALALLGRQLRAGPRYALVEKVEEREAPVRAVTDFTIEF